ncbi:MAG: SulP family inorganic anion transporter [Gallionella sp.]
MPNRLSSAISSIRQDFSGDIWGGLAAMLVALPSAIAFGVIIFSPLGGALAAQGALAGILGAIALGLVAPVFGGCPRLITAPCAPAAALLSALAINFMQQGVPVQAALLMLVLIGLLTGLTQIALGLVGVGRLIRFIPYPVVSGYLSGVGLIIIGSQIPKFLGASAEAHWPDAIANPSGWVWQSIAVGGVVIAVVVFIPRIVRAVPPAILALLAGVASYLALGVFDPSLLTTERNPLLIGTMATGEGGFLEMMSQQWQALSGLGMDAVAMVAIPSLTLAVLLSIDTLKTCVVMDAMTNSHHDSNRELIGQGLGNISSSLVGGVPGSGTMGASLVNISSGGKTRFSGMMAGGFSLLAYLLLAPLIAWVPVAALAGILIVIGFRMIDRHSLAFFFTPATRLDFAVIISVILVALFVNLIAASGVGVALAILLFIREQTRSSVVRNRIEGREIFTKRLSNHQASERGEQDNDMTIVFELQGSLFFGTANQLQSALEPETGRRKYVVLSMRRVQSLDVTATHVLEQIKDRLEENNAYLVFCDIPKGLPSGLKMKRFLKDTGVVRPTNKAFAFGDLDVALEWIEARELESATIEEKTLEVALDVRAMPIFAGHTEKAITALEAVLELRFIEAGKKVFKTDTAEGELFFIRRGTVKVMIPIRKKEHYHLATCGPGEIIGGTGFLDARHLSVAIAMADTEVYALSRASFDALAEQHRALGLAIIEHVALSLATRLRVAVGEIQALRG